MDSDFQRPDWTKTFMEITELIAKRSTCCKLQTGALLIKDNRIVSIGYNGVTYGQEHCTDFWLKFWKINYSDLFETFEEFKNSDIFLREHHCILYAAKVGKPTENTEIYSLYSPCINCVKTICASKITKVYYRYIYKNARGIEFLEDLGIQCIQVK